MSVPEVQIPFLRTDPASFERRVNTLIGRKPRMPPPIRLMRQGDPQRTTGSEAPLSQDRSAAASYSQGNAVVPPAAPPRPLSWHGLSPASSMVMTPGGEGANMGPRAPWGRPLVLCCGVSPRRSAGRLPRRPVTSSPGRRFSPMKAIRRRTVMPRLPLLFRSCASRPGAAGLFDKGVSAQREAQMLVRLSIVGAVGADPYAPHHPVRSRNRGAVNPGAAVRGAVVRASRLRRTSRLQARRRANHPSTTLADFCC
jgi:hypothetical protein